MSRNKQVSETHLLGLLLAVVGGFLDAYTYLCRGRVFANAQTGNIVLLGVNLTEQNWNRTFYYLMPIFAFVLGILYVKSYQTYFKWKKKLHWRQLIVLIEIFCLIVAGFLPSSAFDAPVNIMISFVCALQVEAFRKMNGNTYATTMCTGNLRSASQQLYLYITTRQKSYLHNCLQYYNVILFFILGAGCRQLFHRYFSYKSRMALCTGAFSRIYCHVFKQGGESMSHADTQLKEQKDHGTSLFPCALYEVCEEKNWSGVPHHWHDEMEILYFSKGSYTLFVNMEQFQIEEKCFYFIYPGELHAIVPHSDSTESALVFHPSLLGFEYKLFPQCLKPSNPAFSPFEKEYRKVFHIFHQFPEDSLSARLFIQSGIFKMAGILSTFPLFTSNRT